MKITELKKNERTKKFDYFRVSFIDGTFIFKINSQKQDFLWSLFKYPVGSMLKNIQFLDDFSEYLIYRAGLRNSNGIYQGVDFAKTFVVWRVE